MLHIGRLMVDFSGVRCGFATIGDRWPRVRVLTSPMGCSGGGSAGHRWSLGADEFTE